jgi:hypothetical protein
MNPTDANRAEQGAQRSAPQARDPGLCPGVNTIYYIIYEKGNKKMADRFVLSDKKGVVEGTKIITDTKTGVQYLFAYWGNAGGLTLLVDKDGKPLISENYIT